MEFLSARFRLLCFLLVSPGLFLYAQNEGLPFINNFSPKQYRQGPQNFAVLQDRQGLLYFGNNNGVIIYDGHRWELVTVKNESEVHSLAEGPDGKVFVGAQGEFGYLTNNPLTGEVQYVSMLDLIPENERDFNDIWNIYYINDEVIVRSNVGMFVINKRNEVQSLRFETSTHRSFVFKKEVYVREENAGLKKLVNGKLESVPGGEKFLHEAIYFMLPYGDDALVFAQNQGLLLFDGKEFRAFDSPANDLIRGQGAQGIMLPDGKYALGTRRNGVLVINFKGEILHHISKDDGLINESIWGLCVEKFTNNLWVATNNGISFLEIQSPFTSFQALSGLPAQVYHIVRHSNTIYASTSLGVYYKDLTGKDAAKFQPLTDIPGQAWAFHSDHEDLLVATNQGVFQIRDKRAKNIGITGRAWLLVQLSQRPGHVLVNGADGFVILKKEKTGFVVHKKLPRFTESLYYFVEDGHGDIWADSPIRGIYKIGFDKDFSNEISYKLYNSSNGFPSDLKVMGFLYNNEVRFATEEGIYRHDADADSMVFDTVLNEKVFGSDRPSIEWIEQDHLGNFWFILRRQEGKDQVSTGGFALLKANGTYDTDVNAFWRIHDVKLRDFLFLDNHQVFVGTSDGIFHFNPGRISRHKYPVVLRRVTLMRTDSSITIPAQDKLKVPFDQNAVRFEFAGMGFSGNSFEYQTRLEGFDRDWTAWTMSNTKEFTQLAAGEYTFHLRAKDTYNNISDELVIPFTVVTPWFRTPWAYAVYVILGIMVVVVIEQWRSRSLVAQNTKLEKLISQRTADLAKAQITIAGQNEELKNVNFNLEQKVAERTRELQEAYQNLLSTKNELDTFIYRSSHDIKGPLLRLLGLCNVALMDVKDPAALTYFQMLEKEIYVTNRILHKLIVYYYVKNATVTIERVNVQTVLAKVMDSLRRIDGHNEIMIIVDNSADVEVETDAYLLETSLYNVIENAITYRNANNARVKISVAENNGTFEISIADNGRGISRDVSKHIFEMFYRGSEFSPGAGLGLYITNLALKKISGNISFDGSGETVFKISVPITVNSQMMGEIFEKISSQH